MFLEDFPKELTRVNWRQTVLDHKILYSMVIDDLNIKRVAFHEAKADAPLAVDSDTPSALAITLKSLQTVRRRRLEVINVRSRIELCKPHHRSSANLRRQASAVTCRIKPRSLRIGKRLNHSTEHKQYVYGRQVLERREPAIGIGAAVDFSLRPFVVALSGIGEISPADKTQLIQFSNDGAVAPILYSNDFASELSANSPTDGSYTLTFRDLETRLSAPVDERLTKPRNYVAADSGQWMGWNLANSTTKIEPLHFAAALNEGFRGSYFQTCFTAPLFHPQHVIRLPNKNGRAYFMVAQSRPLGGYIYLLETYAGVLDPVTDLVPQNGNTALGKIIWQSEFGSTPIGNWNHPGKMSLQGGVLVVAAQNWSEGQGTDECSWTRIVAPPGNRSIRNTADWKGEAATAHRRRARR